MTAPRPLSIVVRLAQTVPAVPPGAQRGGHHEPPPPPPPPPPTPPEKPPPLLDDGAVDAVEEADWRTQSGFANRLTVYRSSDGVDITNAIERLHGSVRKTMCSRGYISFSRCKMANCCHKVLFL